MPHPGPNGEASTAARFREPSSVPSLGRFALSVSAAKSSDDASQRRSPPRTPTVISTLLGSSRPTRGAGSRRSSRRAHSPSGAASAAAALARSSVWIAGAVSKLLAPPATVRVGISHSKPGVPSNAVAAAEAGRGPTVAVTKASTFRMSAEARVESSVG